VNKWSLFAAAMVWSSCGWAAAAPGTAAEAAAPPPLTAAAQSEIDGLLQSAVTDGRVASVTVQVRRLGQVVYSKSVGYADLEFDVKATPDDLYAIGSITKSMTAYCILTLVSEGRLKLSDRLSDILPDYPGAGGEATIRQLLTHTSGIHDYAGDSAPDLIGDPTRLFTEDQVVALFAKQPLDFPAGEHWRYSNSGFFLLGLVIEKVTGRPYDEVVRDLLFKPFGLSRILMDYRQPLMKSRVRGYSHAADGSFQNVPVYDASVALAAGGYRASVGDLTRYIEALFSDQVPAAVRSMMMTPMTLNDGTEISYRPMALVASRLQGHPVYAHAGGIWGAHAFISYMPADQAAIGLFTNTEDGSVNLGDLNRKIARVVLNIPHPPLRDLPLTRREAEAYEGSYCPREIQEEGGKLMVSYDGGSLTIARSGEAGAAHVRRLRNQGKGVFVPGDDEDATVRFRRGKGSLESVEIETSPGGVQSGPRC
jgi:D-alanyl-D-alanine carboxypeptidase